MFLLMIVTFIVYFQQSYGSYEDCLKKNGKEIAIGVCIPDSYNKLSPPIEHPSIVQVKFRITGLKKVDLLANMFSIYVSIKRIWHDSRIQAKWNQNETLKYLLGEINDKIWLPWIYNPHFLNDEMSDRQIMIHHEVTILLTFRCRM